MPSVSKAQQAVMSLAEHDPAKLKKRNRGLLAMSHEQLHDFAATPTKDLPEKKEGALRRLAKGIKK